MQQKNLHAYTHCLCRLVAVPVLMLSLCRSLFLSFSVGLDPVDRPRLRRVCALMTRRSRGGTGGGGGGGAGADVMLGPGKLLWLWMGYTVAEFCTCEGCPWIRLEASSGGGGGGGHGCLSSRRSLFSWLRRSSCTSNSSMRRRCVSSNFCWLSMMLLSSNRYSTARLGLSGLPWPVSMLKEPCTSEQMSTAGLMEQWDYNHPKYESSPPHVMLVGGGGGGGSKLSAGCYRGTEQINTVFTLLLNSLKDKRNNSKKNKCLNRLIIQEANFHKHKREWMGMSASAESQTFTGFTMQRLRQYIC